MEEHQRPRFVSRSPAASANAANNAASGHKGGHGGGRSQWHGMDLHTTTPSSHRRAMYISPIPVQTPSIPTSAVNANATTTGENARQRAEAAALSARNQVLHRRLSERKRFDSADYAMKMVRSAMETDPKEDPAAVASPPPTGSYGGGVSGVSAAHQSPRLSPTHGRLVFAHALKGNHRSGDGDYDMADAGNNQDSNSPPRIAPQATRGYGALQQQQHPTTSASSKAKAANAALSARNVMIQRKLQEKRHFDSADYQLAKLGVTTDVAMDQVGKPALDPSALPFDPTLSPLDFDPKAASPVNSPSAARAAVSRSNQMSPSVRAGSNAAATGFTAKPDASKYGNMGAPAKPRNDLRRNTLLRQQETFLAAQTPTSPALSEGPHQSQGPSNSAASGNQKYGKLIAANILLRKNLKERQRFDSADHEMEAAAKQAQQAEESDNNNTATGPSSPVMKTAPPSNQDEEPSSPVLKPQAKHMKLSGDVATGGWAAHVKSPHHPEQAPQFGSTKSGWAAHPAVAASRQARTPTRDDGARLAARSVVLSRKLSEGKKIFDSGEYFAAKDKEARASDRQQV